MTKHEAEDLVSDYTDSVIAYERAEVARVRSTRQEYQGQRYRLIEALTTAESPK